MTSKEIIQNEINNLKDMIENSKKLNCGTIIKACEEEIEQYQQVLKELEILDILKPYFEGAILDGDFHFRFTPKQEKSIKEWINNDK